MSYKQTTQYNPDAMKTLLSKADLNLTGVSKITGIARSTLYRFKDGEKPESLEILEKLSNYFGVKIGYFFDPKIVYHPLRIIGYENE
jgi:transcriptional regulator with XRE-family HTH domain